jgi:alanine racemase
MSTGGPRSRIEVDLDAIAHNTAHLARAAPGAVLCAVVKADGYGHGAVPVATAALASGAGWLAVAHAQEASSLRAGGIDAPVLLLTEPTPDEVPAVLADGLRTVLYSHDAVAALGRAAARARCTVPVHLKVDTGMRRVGCRPAEVVGLVEAIGRHPHLELEGLMTHFAVADEPDHPANERQRSCFAEVLAALDRRGLRPPFVHAANSAALLADPASHHDLVRAGIALYGLAPGPALEGRLPLRPALALYARVIQVKRACAGEGVSYGWRSTLEAETVLATLAIGYADGVRRPLGTARTPVLIGGRRRPMAGVVTMDQLIVDCGADAEVAVGEEAALLGGPARDAVRAEEWAERLGTISYEVLTGLGPRTPRSYVGRRAG